MGQVRERATRGCCWLRTAGAVSVRASAAGSTAGGDPWSVRGSTVAGLEARRQECCRFCGGRST
jgi:hypothetical protein